MNHVHTSVCVFNIDPVCVCVWVCVFFCLVERLPLDIHYVCAALYIDRVCLCVFILTLCVCWCVSVFYWQYVHVGGEGPSKCVCLFEVLGVVSVCWYMCVSVWGNWFVCVMCVCVGCVCVCVRSSCVFVLCRCVRYVCVCVRSGCVWVFLLACVYVLKWWTLKSPWSGLRCSLSSRHDVLLDPVFRFFSVS